MEYFMNFLNLSGSLICVISLLIFVGKIVWCVLLFVCTCVSTTLHSILFLTSNKQPLISRKCTMLCINMGNTNQGDTFSWYVSNLWMRTLKNFYRTSHILIRYNKIPKFIIMTKTEIILFCIICPSGVGFFLPVWQFLTSNKEPLFQESAQCYASTWGIITKGTLSVDMFRTFECEHLRFFTEQVIF
jgi:hypothetical protein